MPVFSTRWDFLFASVLIGVDRSTGVFSGSEPTPGQQMVAVWTSTEVAEEALHVESWELRPILVRDLIALLPAGIGVQVDPERPSGMTASPAYVAGLKQVAGHFPVGSALRVAGWEELPDAARSAAAGVAVEVGLRELHAFMYTVDDSPAIGCLAWVGEVPDAGTVARSLESAVVASGGLAALQVATVHVLDMTYVPEELRSVLGDRHAIHRRRRSRPWRR